MSTEPARVRSEDARIGDRIRILEFEGSLPGVEGHVLSVYSHSIIAVLDEKTMTEDEKAMFLRSADGTIHYVLLNGEFEVFGRKVQG
jgi:hypothetical protein